MQIAVDAHAIGQRLTGNEVYVRSLLEEYARLDRDIEFITYISVPAAEEQIPRGFRRRYVSRNPFVRLGAQLRTKLREDQPDLVHVQYTAPLSCPVPIVATVHDVSYIDHPEYFPALRAAQLRLSIRHTLKRAAKVITISEFSRRCISTAFDLDLDDIAVTPLAAQDCFQPMNRAHAIRKVSERLGIRQPFLLNVGDLHPRKKPDRANSGFQRTSDHLSAVAACSGAGRQTSLVRAAGDRGGETLRTHRTNHHDRVRERRVTAGPLQRGRSVCIPFLLRGFWTARDRGDGLWPPRRLLERNRVAGKWWTARRFCLIQRRLGTR